MKKDRILFIIIPLLLGFLMGGFLFNNNNLQTLLLNNKQDFSDLIAVWGKGSGELATLSSKQVFISNRNLKTKFNLAEDLKVSIDPVSERDEYMNQVVEEAETCSDIEFERIADYELRESDLNDLKVGEKADYFLIFNKKSNQFIINRLITER
jgi:hypothetical protein